MWESEHKSEKNVSSCSSPHTSSLKSKQTRVQGSSIAASTGAQPRAARAPTWCSGLSFGIRAQTVALRTANFAQLCRRGGCSGERETWARHPSNGPGAFASGPCARMISQTIRGWSLADQTWWNYWSSWLPGIAHSYNIHKILTWVSYITPSRAAILQSPAESRLDADYLLLWRTETLARF